MTEFDVEEMRLIVNHAVAEIVPRAVRETLVSIGIDPSRPLEVQADMQALRQWRQANLIVKATALKAAIGALVAALVGWGMYWFGFPRSP